MRPNIIRAMLAGLLTVVAVRSHSLNQPTRSLSGVVLDAQGAVVPHAEVVAIDTQTGQATELPAVKMVTTRLRIWRLASTKSRLRQTDLKL